MPSSNWRIEVSDALRTRLWPVPLMGVLLAIAAGFGLPVLDQRVDDALPPARLLFASTIDNARELLGTISTAMVTVTSLTFSLTVVTLQLASGQYSPRLMRTFARDRFVQTTMALFLSSFAFALTVLHHIGSGRGAVPQISVSVAAMMALLSVIGLVFFLAHLVGEIRVETMMGSVYADAIAAGRNIFQAMDSQGDRRPTPQPPANAALVEGLSTGFLVSIDEDSLVSAAVQADAVVLINRKPGDWLVSGDVLALAWSYDSREALEGKRLEQLAERISATVRTANERTPVQDVGYGLRQLTDVALKALSPAVNDPTTAVHALGYSCALLCELVRRHVEYTALYRGDVARAVIRQPKFSELFDLAVGQPRRSGAHDPSLLARLFTLLREVGWQATDPVHKSTVAEQLARLRRTVAEQDFDDVELEGLVNLGHDVEAVLSGDWRPRVGRIH